jgi:hypothetical protein
MQAARLFNTEAQTTHRVRAFGARREEDSRIQEPSDSRLLIFGCLLLDTWAAFAAHEVGALPHRVR